MIKLRPEFAVTSPLEGTVLCTVVGDSPGGLPIGSQVQLHRFSRGSDSVALYHLITEDGAFWVREVGDEDAAIRLFERL